MERFSLVRSLISITYNVKISTKFKKNLLLTLHFFFGRDFMDELSPSDVSKH